MTTAMSSDHAATACQSCAAPVPVDARFCMSCGQPQSTTEDDAARQARLAGSAPTPLVQKMRAARLTGERKPVTALFADVVGSTGLAETMDPEDWTQMINQAFDLMTQAVFRYEGTIAQLQGDAMLAFFGAPVAHEDDPERAVLAALDMVAATDEFARQLKETHGIDFRIRAGINTGPVVVGNVGTDLRYEYTALGDAMNVAARMQAVAEPGTVVITDASRRLVGDAFELEDLGQLSVKGKTEPVRAYRVVARHAGAMRRRGLQRIGLDSPMVGRDAQLEHLRGLGRIVSAGRGRVCFVIGEPGIGKSRLLGELRDELTADGAADWVEGRCVSYGRTLPYHLVLDLVRSLLGLPLMAGEADVRQIMDDRLSELLGDTSTEAALYFAHLLGLSLDAEEAARTQLDPETMQGRYVAALNGVLRALTAQRPLVIVLEDIHWADPASVEVMLQLLPLLSGLPVLFLAAGRNEIDAPGWRLVANSRAMFGEALTELRLEPLDSAQSRSLVANLLEIESLPEGVRQAILERAGGNPFFVEEVIRMFVEHGGIVRVGERWVAAPSISSLEIPETLHGLLLARIDQLPEQARRSLRVAAVIGRQFPARVLERVLSTTED
jgi:class 3 adenylate cyclase